jgi:hypothetical protein
MASATIAYVVGTCTLTAKAVNDAPTITLDAAAYDTNEDEPAFRRDVRISDQDTAAGSILVLVSSSDVHRPVGRRIGV